MGFLSPYQFVWMTLLNSFPSCTSVQEVKDCLSCTGSSTLALLHQQAFLLCFYLPLMPVGGRPSKGPWGFYTPMHLWLMGQWQHPQAAVLDGAHVVTFPKRQGEN